MGQDEAPEFWTMIHVLAVGHFMGGDIIQDMAGGEDQAPVVGQIAGRGARAPSAFLVTDGNPLEINGHGFCVAG